MINQSFQETNKFSISSRVQWLIVIACITMVFAACSKTDNYKSDQLREYMPLAKGKYWIYLLDSTNYYNSQKVQTQYQLKDVVDDSLTDNLNRIAYRLIRYIRPSSSINDNDWKTMGEYYMVPTRETLETVDLYNFKYQSLKLPIAVNLTWKGNSYLPAFPYSEASPDAARYNFTVDGGMGDWDFTYTGVGKNDTINGKTYTNVLTVSQEDASTNLLADNQTPTNVNDFATRAYSAEKYAKNIGLIYKKLELWEHQPASPTNPGGYYVGFGIQLQLIDHN
ncbi:hypothetical protein [Pinibacter soli]|uniref:DUF4136 domain-containing protein n=1 Tax=Pinibacter soli TaxID=3044211 RepID=A0ABT6RHQ7_9BACT|nr:hypothetical protein [Pinibacter soli]MDI3321915.1 hypothetical protein [Pinibacter soli]